MTVKKKVAKKTKRRMKKDSANAFTQAMGDFTKVQEFKIALEAFVSKHAKEHKLSVNNVYLGISSFQVDVFLAASRK